MWSSPPRPKKLLLPRIPVQAAARDFAPRVARDGSGGRARAPLPAAGAHARTHGAPHPTLSSSFSSANASAFTCAVWPRPKASTGTPHGSPAGASRRLTRRGPAGSLEEQVEPGKRVCCELRLPLRLELGLLPPTLELAVNAGPDQRAQRLTRRERSFPSCTPPTTDANTDRRALARVRGGKGGRQFPYRPPRVVAEGGVAREDRGRARVPFPAAGCRAPASGAPALCRRPSLPSSSGSGSTCAVWFPCGLGRRRAPAPRMVPRLALPGG